MSRPLTGYALTSHFRKLRLRWDFTHLEAYLFFELVAICNDEGWPVEFSAKNSLLTGALACSEKGLIKARKTLESAGLLTYTEGQNRRPTTYRFCAAKGLPEVSVSEHEHLPQVSNGEAEHLPQGLPEVSVSEGKHLPEGLPKYLPEVSPYKEQTKTKRKVEKESAADAAALAPSFSENAPPISLLTEQQPRPKNPKKTGATGEQVAALLLPHPSEEFAQLWATFRDSPKQQGKALSAFELMLKKLARYPEGFAIVMLERAIQGGWSGVENPGTARAFAEWQTEQARHPAPLPQPVQPAPAALALNQEFIAQQQAEEARRIQAHFARHAAVA